MLHSNQIRNGIFFPDFKTSELERKLFEEFERLLRNAGFRYLSIPSLVMKDTYVKQEVVSWDKVFKINEEFALAGSAEQGILEYFKDSQVESMGIYAKNQCFRAEENYEGFKRLREFIKLEQYIFCEEKDYKEKFDLVLNLALDFLRYFSIKHRVINVTDRDPGYHLLKYDIEVYTKTYDWIETHSCSYFGTEQTKRFNITGATHTISNTGIASPRILIPFLEREI